MSYILSPLWIDTWTRTKSCLVPPYDQVTIPFEHKTVLSKGDGENKTNSDELWASLIPGEFGVSIENDHFIQQLMMSFVASWWRIGDTSQIHCKWKGAVANTRRSIQLWEQYLSSFWLPSYPLLSMDPTTHISLWNTTNLFADSDTRSYLAWKNSHKASVVMAAYKPLPGHNPPDSDVQYWHHATGDHTYGSSSLWRRTSASYL